jgi:hypothetical protein
VPRSRHEREDAFSDSELRAAHVVRAHSRNPFKFSRHFYHRRSRPTKARYASKGADQEKAADMTSPMTRTPGGGILSALLALYDRDSDMVSVSDTMTETYSTGTRTPDGGQRDSRTHSLLDLASASGKRLATASKALHLPEPRPRRERNAAGVWGPLIASTTGALVGAAAPSHSTIAPDVKRPGYHLSRWVHYFLFCTSSPNLKAFLRYSLDGNISRPPAAVSSQRPRSMLSEPGTQHHSTTASSSSNSHVDSSAHGSPSPHVHHASWMENLPKLHWPAHAGAPHGAENAATESERVDEKGYVSTDTEAEAKRDVSTWKRERKKRRRKAEIYVRFSALSLLQSSDSSVLQITRHISSLISRQTFILKLARAMMMFGGPTHRLQAQVQSTARVLEISLSCMYLPDLMLIAFDDDVTSTSNVKLIRQVSALDLGKLQDAHKIYWRVGVSLLRSSEEGQLMRQIAGYSR